MSNNEVSGVKPPFLSDRSYDALKWIALVLLPGVGSLYFALAGLWDLPKATEVVGTVTAVDLFFGLLLGLSAKSYAKSGAKYDGSINMETQTAGADSKTVYSLELGPNVDVNDLPKHKELLFKVNPPPEQ